MNSKLKVSVGVLLVFVLGILAGSLGTQAYMKYRVSRFVERGHEARAELFLGRLSHDLDLTETQQTEIRKDPQGLAPEAGPDKPEVPA